MSMIMKLRFFIKKAPKRGDSVTTATIYARLTIGHKTDISATLPLSVNPNHWDVAGQCVKARAVCDERMHQWELFLTDMILMVYQRKMVCIEVCMLLRKRKMALRTHLTIEH